jgi:hypothetical protein
LFSLVFRFSPKPKWHIRIAAPQLSIKHQSILKHDDLMTNHRAACPLLIGDYSGVERASSAVVLKPGITMRIPASSSE